MSSVENGSSASDDGQTDQQWNQSWGKSEGFSKKLSCIGLRGTVQYHHDVAIPKTECHNVMDRETNLTSSIVNTVVTITAIHLSRIILETPKKVEEGQKCVI